MNTHTTSSIPFTSRGTAALLSGLLTACLLAACGGGGGGSAGTPGAAAEGPQPQVSSVVQTTVPLGSRFVVNGTQLDLAQRFVVGTTTLERIAGSTATQVILQAPQERLTGRLSTVDAQSVRRDTPFTLQAYEPVRISSTSPVEGQYLGRTVVVTGQALDTVTAVRLNGSPAAFTNTLNTLTLTIPGDAAVGQATLEVTSPFESVSGGSIRVLPTVRAQGLQAVTVADRATIRVTGRDLKQVAAVRVGTTPAQWVSVSDDQIVVSVARGTAGPVILEAGAQGPVDAGYLAASDYSTVQVSKMEFGQVYAMAEDDPRLRLTIGKPAGVRVAITADKPGLAAGPVVLRVLQFDGRELDTLPMSGPAQLPTAVDPERIQQFFSTRLPSRWVQPGVRYALSATVNGQVVTREIPAPISPPTHLRVVLIPVHLGSFKPIMPSVEELRSALAHVTHYALNTIEVTTSTAPIEMALDQVATREGASELLARVEARRRAEDPQAVFYGVFPQSGVGLPSAAIGGMAYGNTSLFEPNIVILPSAWNYSGIGAGVTPTENLVSFKWSTPFMSSLGPVRTFIHEVSHMHGLGHANCGGALGISANLPHQNGELGSTLIYGAQDQGDNGVGIWTRPKAGQDFDVMGYCGGAYLSDFHYLQLRTVAETRDPNGVMRPKRPSSSAGDGESGSATALQVLSGGVSPKGFAFYPVVTARGQADPVPSRSDWMLTVRLRSGQTVDLPLPMSELSTHVPGYYGFVLRVPQLGPIESTQLRHKGQLVPSAQP